MSPVFPSRRRLITLAGIGFAVAMTTSLERGRAAAMPRPEHWAEPVDLPGVPNLHRVAPSFYRSAQPTREGFASLARELGVRTVVSLRAFHADEMLAGGNGLHLARIPIHTWHIEQDDVITALKTLLAAQKHGPVLLHCQHGSDRTGLISALYRVMRQDWSKADALAEMRDGEFGYHAIWGNIPRYLKTADITALETGIGPV